MKSTAEIRQSPHVVYRAFDERGRLLYVGCTHDLSGRLEAHRATSAWHPLATRVEQSAPATFEDARAAEAHAIKTEEPLYNYDAPLRAWARKWRREIHSAATRLSTYDGWWLNDAHAIGNATADLLIPDYPVGTPLHRCDYYSASLRIEEFNEDQVKHVARGYLKLRQGGWESNPDSLSRPQGLLDRWSMSPDIAGRPPLAAAVML